MKLKKQNKKTPKEIKTVTQYIHNANSKCKF